MKTVDFSHYAEPWLTELQDDPEQRPEDIAPHRGTFADSLTNLIGEGSVLTIGKDEELPNDGEANLDKADIGAAQDAYPLLGLDVLAFYKSFRFMHCAPFAGSWGIYLLDVGVAAIELDMRTHAPHLPRKELRGLAAQILLAHERYHFWIDAWALGQEIAPLRVNYRRYEPYLAAKRMVELTPDDYEESLANYYVFKTLGNRRFSDGSSMRPVLKHILDGLPSPYCDYLLGQHSRAEREGLLAAAIANGVNGCVPNVAMRLCSRSLSVLSGGIQPCNARHPVTGWSRCPVHYVRTYNYASVASPFRGPTLREFRDFITSYLNGRQLSTTDHSHYRIDNGERVKLPNPHDKEVRGYELKGTLLKAGMRPKEYLEARTATDNWSKNCPRSVAKPSLVSH